MKLCHVFWMCLLGSWGGVFLRAQASDTNSVFQFEFREPQPRAYLVPRPSSGPGAKTVSSEWIKAWPVEGGGDSVEMGNRIVLQISPRTSLAGVLDNSSARWSRTVTDNLFILQAADAWSALNEAERLARQEGVTASYPVKRRKAVLRSAYAPKPNDSYFAHQWNMENRGADGSRLGADINLRSAWPVTRGAGIVVAIVDQGVELTHPDLKDQSFDALHYNYVSSDTNGSPVSRQAAHGTAVTGILAATANNERGIAGVAPEAKFASWVIFNAADDLASEEQMMDMYQMHSNVVSVQNHSWGNAEGIQVAVPLLEEVGISNAVHYGRNGKGVIMVRAAGNGRLTDGANANDDGYVKDPLEIGVAAVRSNGRVTSYSSPGACNLVAGPSSDLDEGYPSIFTTDLLGSDGYNQISFTNDLADYCFDAYGFSGTSAATPHIAGIAALMLAANPALEYRDVQQILILAARQTDPGDPDTVTNGTGFLVNHNLGFGVPDAGVAVRLAQQWTNRPALTNLVFDSPAAQDIPDEGLRLLITGSQVPDGLASIVSVPSLGPHADAPTSVVPLVDVGMATNEITVDLHGKAALIQRGTNFFYEKIQYAAAAGAAFVVVYNNRDHSQTLQMAGTEFTPIPAVFINQDDGEALRSLLASEPGLTGQLKLSTTDYYFTVSDTLLLEHVGVRVDVNHPVRGQLRITLLSPQGTRSVLQRINYDELPGPINWTYYSTHHFYESSAGTWILSVSDEIAGLTGNVNSASLILTGVPIVDTDRDGLDDRWEQTWFHSLAYGPKDDPDGDGYNNARAQILGLNPASSSRPLRLNLDPWNDYYLRLSWPAVADRNYDLSVRNQLNSPWTSITNVPGTFPETEWFLPSTNYPQQFLQISPQP
jgi:subtilisin family serine protease/subtilisin-like proprotein convertase family protein